MIEMQRMEPITSAVRRAAPSCLALADNFSFIRTLQVCSVVLLFADDYAGGLNIFTVHLCVWKRGGRFPRKLNDFDCLLPIVGGGRKNPVIAVAGIALIQAEVQEIAVGQEHLGVAAANLAQHLFGRGAEAVSNRLSIAIDDGEGAG